MKPEEGPFAWNILGAQADIESATRDLEFAKWLLLTGTHDSVAEEMLVSAQVERKQAEEDLARWTRKHFDWLQEKHTA